MPMATPPVGHYAHCHDQVAFRQGSAGRWAACGRTLFRFFRQFDVDGKAAVPLFDLHRVDRQGYDLQQ